MIKKVAVVTGAAGFIGSHMVDRLIDGGYKVRAIDDLSNGKRDNLQQHHKSPSFKLFVDDIRKLKEDHPAFLNADYVFHFAGIGDVVPSIEKPVDYMSVNVMGTVRVLEAARKARVKKFVYAASSSCYGKNAPVPTNENAAIDTQYPYALSKYMGEQAALHWGQVYKLPVVSIRIFNAYGTRSRTSGAYGAVIGVFLAQKLAGKPFTVVGDGEQKRDFVYATDLAHAFLAAAESDRTNEIYNIGCNNPQSVNYLVELLGGDKIHIPKRPGEPECTWSDTAKIKKHLDWKPRISFEEGIATIENDIDHWRDAPVWDENSIEKATKTWFEMLK